jgi:hypothetical protein
VVGVRHAHPIMEPPVDLYALLTTLVRIEARLRMVAHYPEHYAANGHVEKIVNLLTVLQAEVDDWLSPKADTDQRQQHRRQLADRRVESRRIGSERRHGAPVTENIA